jgi:CrcB protein
MRDDARPDPPPRHPVPPEEALAEAELARAPDDLPSGSALSRLPVESPEEAIAEAELAEAPEDLPTVSPPTMARRALLGPSLPISGGAVLGANARYLVGEWATTRWPGPFPWGTLLINCTGSLIIGFYLTLVIERFAGRSSTRLFVATGFLGAYTTFSTFSYETVTLIQQGRVTAAILYVIASLILGLVGVIAGTLVAHAL